MNRLRLRPLPILVILAAVAVLVAAILVATPDKPIPPQIKKQLTSALIVPQGSDSDLAVIEQDSPKYDKREHLLTYNVKYAGHKLVVGQQPTPPQFTEIPKFYETFRNQAGEYASFDSTLGTVYLIKPQGLKGSQNAAVLNAKGTLIMVKSDDKLSEDDWKKFFLTLDVEK
jgi:hypothetical protein